MRIDTQIHARLTDALAPETLDVQNESAKHAGHASDDGSGESHFHVTIKAASLDDLSRIGRHRAIHDAIGKDLMGRIHALGITVL